MNQSHLRNLSLAAGLAAVGGLAFFVGRLSVDEPAAAPAAERALASSAPARAPQRQLETQPGAPAPAQAGARVGPARVDDLVVAPPQQGQATLSAASIGWEGDENTPPPPVVLERVFGVVAAALENPEDAEAAQTARAATVILGAMLQQDSALLGEALRQLPTIEDTNQLVVLSTLLAYVGDPRVEASALQLAEQAALPQQRAAGLRVLDGLDAPQARAVALRALEREVGEPELRRLAIEALPPVRGSSPAEAGEVVAALTRTLERDETWQARQGAALRLAEWQRGPADLEPLLRHFQSDPSLEVRATCALALGVARARTPQIQRTLAEALGDERAPAAVREAAWSALGTLSPLPADVQAAFQAYAQQR